MLFRSSLCFLTAFGCASLATAADPVAVSSADEGTWSLTTAVTSRYLFRGTRVADESLQPSLDYTRGPLALGVWSSVGLSHQVSGDSDPEIDFYGAYSFFNDNERWSVVPAFNLYTYPGAERRDGFYRATFEPSLSVSYTASGIRFTPTIYHDFTLRGTTAEFTADFALPLTGLGTTLEFAATVGTFKWNSVTADASPREKNWGDYWTAGVTLPFTIGTRSSVSLGLLYSEGHDNFYKLGPAPKQVNEDAGGHFAVTLSYTVEL